ncbi:MAG: hypothetical protein HS114_28745 [Anaerolineales bacterium]|nr:hypothetical protein [Anaerolineales bacterium]
MSKQSIPTWLKRNNGWGGPYEKIVEAALHHAQHGEYPNIAFEGTTLELVTAIYVEHAKRAGALDGLYLTWRNVADKMANSLDLQPDDVLLIPGFGLGALYDAARRIQPELRIVSVECQNWLVQIAEAVGISLIKGDFLGGVSLPLKVNKVLCNPPMGRLWGYNKVEADFLAAIARHTQPGDLVAILLPGEPGYWWEKLPNAHKPLNDLFEIQEEELVANPAAPKSITCTRYLLERV